MSDAIERAEKSVQTRWVPEFRYVRNTSAPFVPFEKELAQAKGAIITTGGVFPKGQTPFQDNYGLGDPSYRELPRHTPVKDYMHYHEHYDHTQANQDINVIFPIERMEALVQDGTIGDLAETHFSFMGYQPIAHPLQTRTAPDVARKLIAQQVDFVVLVPV